MHASNPAGSSLLGEALQCIYVRRVRYLFLTAIALLLFGAGWVWHTDNVPEMPKMPSFKALQLTVSSQPKPHRETGTMIPPKIWQMILPKNPEDRHINPDMLQNTKSWLAMNPDYQYTLVGEKGADAFVEQHFSHHPTVLATYKSISNVGMKSDLLRYLILSVEGGVYSDTDTRALKPINTWIPPRFRSQTQAVIGLEFDRRDGAHWADILHDVQFCQWTIAAAPDHPIFEKMAMRVVESLQELSFHHNKSLEELHPSSFDVMNSTGPAAWTDVVFEQLQEYDPTLNGTWDLSFMTEPRLIGDVLVLTIDGFGMGQPHSESTNDGSIPPTALIQHYFHGSWRGNKRKRTIFG